MGARGDAGVSGARVGGGVAEVVVQPAESLVRKALEPILAESMDVAGEVVGPHLVHGDGHDEPGRRGLAFGQEGRGHGQRHEAKEEEAKR